MKSVFRPLLASILFLALTVSGCNNAPDDVSVTIGGGAQSVHKGAFTLFSASGAETSGVTWTIVEADKHVNTAIDSTGLLFVAQGEEKTTLTVKATALSNPSVSETVNVTIPAATARVDMGAQPIYPLQGHADMLPGDYRLLTAYNLDDPYETELEWEWEIIGAVDELTIISIDSVGWFRDPEKDMEPNEEEEIAVTSATIEISENETMGNVFMLKATHPHDPDIFGYATVSVRRPSITKVTVETEQERAAPGDTVTIMVLVIGTGTIPEEDGNVLLSISGNTSEDTQISQYDRGWGGAELTVAADEAAQSINVRASSQKNPNIYEDITIDLELEESF
jgi:hypothetical protein